MQKHLKNRKRKGQIDEQSKRNQKYKDKKPVGALAVLCNYRCSCRRTGLGTFEDHGSRNESYLGMGSGTFFITILYDRPFEMKRV